MADEITSNPAPAEVPTATVLETAQIETSTGAVSEPEQASEPLTAQMGGNEPLTSVSPESVPDVLVPASSATEEIQQAITEQTVSTPISTETTSEPVQVESTPVSAVASVIAPVRDSIHELFTKAQLAIQNRKRKKIDRVMNMFAKQTNITNDEVEKLLHVSDATATRYLSTLEKEGKIKRSGRTGKWVSYSKL